MSRTFEYKLLNRDPEVAAKMTRVLTKLLDQQLAEVETLATAEIETPYRVDPRSPNAGQKFLDQHKSMTNARAARKREVFESLRLIGLIDGMLVKPRKKAEEQDEQDEHEAERALEDIANAFREGATSVRTECWNAAGAMFRLAIDLATKKLVPPEWPKKLLAGRLADLFREKIAPR